MMLNLILFSSSDYEKVFLIVEHLFIQSSFGVTDTAPTVHLYQEQGDKTENIVVKRLSQGHNSIAMVKFESMITARRRPTLPHCRLMF